MTPSSAHVEKHCAADVEKTEQVVLRVDAMLQRQQRQRSAVLITQRIASQTRIAAQQYLTIRIQCMRSFAMQSCIK